MLSSSGKKQPRGEPKFNFSVINEIRSVICAETFTMISQKSMTVAIQRQEVFKKYHGKDEIMGQAEKFMKRMSVYADMWVSEQSKFGKRYCIAERLHQQYGKTLVAGDNISEGLIRQLYASNTDELLSGATIIAKAKEAVKEAKKMHGFLRTAVKERVLEKVEGGEYSFPSGRSEDDFDQWLLQKMYNWEKNYGASGDTNDGKKDIIDSPPDKVDCDMELAVDCDEAIMLPVPKTIFQSPSVEANTSALADDDDDHSSCGDRDPPQNYLPKGWVLFKTRGPMSLPIESRLDFFSESFGEKRNIKNGRDHFRKGDASEKSLGRDFAFDDMSTSVTSKDMRGLGQATKTFVVRAAQREAQLSLQRFENSLLKVNTVMKSKQGQRDSHMELVKLHMAMGDTDEAKKELALAKASMTEIAELETITMNLDATTATKTETEEVSTHDDEGKNNVSKEVE